MKGLRLVFASLLLLPAGWAILHASGMQDAPRVPPTDPAANARAVVDRYCVTCHNQRTRTSDLALDGVDIASPASNGEIWEGVVRRLRTRSMPPHGMPRPDGGSYDSLATYLETELDKAAAAKVNPGRPLIRRLNRSEYANSVRDLLALDVDVASLLPPDDSAFGFDNISDLLGTSPALLERYLVAADRVSALAVGGAVSPGSDTYRIRQDRSQDQHIEGLPLGTVGGAVVKHTFPLDAEYRFSLELYRTNLEAIRGLEHPHQIEITVDGERVFIITVGGDNDPSLPAGASITERSDAVDPRLTVTVPVKAGPHDVGASFVRKIGEGTQRLRPFLRSSAGTYDSTGRPHIETLTVRGPFNPVGPGNTPSRERVFSCRPGQANQEEACATKILSTLARRAYRRPVTTADTSRLMTFYRAGRVKGTFE